MIWHSHGRMGTWRMPGERYLLECVVSIVKFAGPSVMICGCFSWFGTGPLVLVSGNINSEVYVNILDSNMLSTLATVWNWAFYLSARQ